MSRSRPVRAFALTTTLATTMALVLTGCSADARVGPIEEAIATSVTQTTPQLIGVLTPDVSKAVSAAGEESRVMIPILAPDLSTATAEVNAEPGSTELFLTAAAAAEAIGDSGRVAWEDWLAANKDAVGYVETSIPVTVNGKDASMWVEVDEPALQVFAQPLEQANLELFVRAAEATKQWQRTMVVVHAWDFLPQVTGLSPALAGNASIDRVEPAGDGRFEVAVRHLDAKAAVLDQVRKALESYGTGKIWGKVTQADFEARMETVTDVTADEVTTNATVKVSTTDDPGIYLLSQSLADNLAEQAYRYRVEAEPGSFPAPEDLGKVRSDAIAEALAELAKRTIEEQKRPGTGLLVKGKSGSQVTVDVGSGADVHVTFFKWGSKKPAVSAFIRKGKKLMMRLPPGNYRLVYATGDSWFGTKRSFGPTGRYVEFKNKAGTKPAKIQIKRNWWYAYSLMMDRELPAGQDSIPTGTIDNPFEE